MPRALARTAILALALTACGDRSDSAATDLPCEGGAGGNLTLTDRTEMVYTVSFRRDSAGNDAAHIESVIVGRGAPGWKAVTRDRAPAGTSHDSATLATMAHIGKTQIGYEREKHAVWVYNERLALDTFNVMLLDRVDSTGGPPIVAQRVRVAPMIPLAPGACGARANPGTMAWADSIRSRLMRSPDVRAFAAP